MAKRNIWTDKTVKHSELADFLTVHNLQPAKFKLVPINSNHVMVVYIERTVENES